MSGLELNASFRGATGWLSVLAVFRVMDRAKPAKVHGSTLPRFQQEQPEAGSAVIGCLEDTHIGSWPEDWHRNR